MDTSAGAPYTANARVLTDRAGRYLVQLCEHLNSMGPESHRPGADHGRASHQGGAAVGHGAMSVDYTPQRGKITFANGTCTLTADAEALSLRIEADDRPALSSLQASIASRLELVGRRDALVVGWTPE